MYAAVAVRAAGRDVNLADRPGQPLPAKLGRGDRFSLGFAVVLPGHTDNKAAAITDAPASTSRAIAG